jgi:DnaJ-domain-containing protein 1
MAYKMCTLIFEIISALCLISAAGYDTVLDVISQVKGEQYRFERLVQGLHDLTHAYKHSGIVSKLSSLIEEQQELLVFDCIASGLGLFNAIVEQPEKIEKRDALRTELERRGFEDFLKRLDQKRHTLPDSLQKQMDTYLKQKKMDGDKLRVLENNKRASILQL